MVEVRESDINIESLQWHEEMKQHEGTNFVFEKKDKLSGAPIAGAMIALEKELTPGAQTFTFCSKKPTNSLGRVEFKGLNPGRYRLKEEEQSSEPSGRARVVIVPSDGIDDPTYYYFNIAAEASKRRKDIKVVAYVVASATKDVKDRQRQQKELAFNISSDPQGSYLFAGDTLCASDGAVYTGNYYASQSLNGTWDLVEHAKGFVPNGQVSIEGLPMGTYFIRPVQAKSWQKSLRFHVTSRTRTVFVDYTQRKTYELLKSDQVGAAVASFSNKYRRQKKRRARKKLLLVGTVVLGLSFLGSQMKRNLDD